MNLLLLIYYLLTIVIFVNFLIWHLIWVLKGCLTRCANSIAWVGISLYGVYDVIQGVVLGWRYGCLSDVNTGLSRHFYGRVVKVLPFFFKQK
jgi:hypothetical protein